METNEQTSKPPPPKTIWTHVRKVLRDMNRTRPFSFYLLLAILVFALLGSRVGSLREDPRRYAFLLCLSFVFFLVVLWRALVDAVEIARKHFHEHHRLYRSTLGDAEFVRELGRRVGKERRDS